MQERGIQTIIAVSQKGVTRMQKNEFAVFVASLKTYFPREQNLLPNDRAMELWFRQLKDIPYQVAEAALSKWVATNKWSPSIADIREIAATMTHGELPDWGEGWASLQKAILRHGQYHQREALAELDDLTRDVVERLGYRTLCLSENQQWDMNNFRRLYELLAERRKDEAQVPQEVLLLVKGFQTDRNLLGE